MLSCSSGSPSASPSSTTRSSSPSSTRVRAHMLFWRREMILSEPMSPEAAAVAYEEARAHRRGRRGRARAEERGGRRRRPGGGRGRARPSAGVGGRPPSGVASSSKSNGVGGGSSGADPPPPRRPSRRRRRPRLRAARLSASLGEREAHARLVVPTGISCYHHPGGPRKRDAAELVVDPIVHADHLAVAVVDRHDARAAPRACRGSVAPWRELGVPRYPMYPVRSSFAGPLVEVEGGPRGVLRGLSP